MEQQNIKKTNEKTLAFMKIIASQSQNIMIV